MSINKADKLRSLIPNMSAKSQAFALSLLSQHGRYNTLSEKQWACVDKMIAEYGDAVPDKFPRIVALMAHAGKRVENPAIYWNLPEARVVARYVAKTGRIYIVDRDRKYFNEKFQKEKFVPYCFLDQDGRVSTYSGFVKVQDALLTKLRAFEADPHKAGAVEGHVTGNCCFCTLKLTTAESVTRGYGPKCASYYGLPWGKSGATVAGLLFDRISDYDDMAAYVESLFKSNTGLLGDEPIGVFIKDQEILNQHRLIGDEPISMLRKVTVS